MWIARDKDGELYLYNERPVREDSRYEKGTFYSGYFYGEYPSIRLDKNEFLEVTWENSPQQVELKLIEK